MFEASVFMKNKWPILGVLLATLVTAVLDVVGLFEVSFLCLFPLVFIFLGIQRLTRREFGFALGRPVHYLLALLYPLLTVAVLAAMALALGAASLGSLDWAAAGSNIAQAILMSFVLGMLTEEAFFRGWLFAALERLRVRPTQVFLWTGVAFAFWHVPASFLSPVDAVSLAVFPVLMLNAVVIGFVWALLRKVSGSIVVASLSHAVWNALTYELFGFGATIGALGVKQGAIYGPESGVLGLLVNLVIAVCAWRWWLGNESARAASDPATGQGAAR